MATETRTSDINSIKILDKGRDVTKKVMKNMGGTISEPKRMGVLGGLKSALGDVSSATKTVGKGITNVGKSLVNTTGNIANFLTGGPRQQTYGYFAEYFQDEKQKIKKEKPFTQIRPSFNLPTAPPQYGASTEQLNNIFDFMKRTQEKQIRQLEVQNSFIEGKLELDKERYSELLKAITKFVNVKTVTATRVDEKKEEGPNILDIVKNMVTGMIQTAISGVMKTFEMLKKGLEWLKDIEWVAKAKELYQIVTKYGSLLLRFLGTPLGGALLGATSLAMFLKMAKDEKEAIEKNPHDPKYVDNPYAMKLRGEAESVAQAGKQNQAKARRTILRNEVEDFVKSSLTDEVLVEETGKDRAGLQKWLVDNPQPTAKYQLPIRGSLASKPTVAPALDETAAETARLTRQNAAASPVAPTPSEPETAKPVETATPAPTTPVSAPVARVIDENRALESERMVEPVTNKPIVVKNNSAQSVNEPPLASTATTRDEEPMIDFVFSKQRNKARGY